MLRFVEKIAPGASVSATVTLSLEQRSKSRLRVTLDDGRDAGIFLARGETLKDGDCLRTEGGEAVRVIAANETVSSVQCEDSLLLARACYHLGNRHVPLQIGKHQLRYRHDHVLDDMLRGLGIEVTVEQAPFEPEPGAYGGDATGGHHHHGDQGHRH